MTQEITKGRSEIVVETQENEDYGNLIPDFAIRRMARLFLTKMREEEETE